MLLQMALFHSFFFYSWVIFHCVYIYLYTFRFHLSVNKHLGCFHVLAIVNSATINTGVLESFQLFPVIGAGLLKIPMAKWWNESGLEESDLGSNPRE